ncbi:protein mono-ADP-ribosyltransferase PARP14-like isoform X2 [Hyperolius riggenbachi]|uniref:protein mono-ADP-ribosyltransferase PARP14-like isoform X2 n=1 Tax=Hyperolius riggenbachi TaxID=752182 RepID=UPI0035A32422
MGDSSYPYPVTLQWESGPNSLKKLKNKILLYFQKKSESGGGECEILDTDCRQGYILIHFKLQADQEQVLQKSSHELKLPGGKKMKLEVRAAGAEGARSSPEPPEPAADFRQTRKKEVSQSPAAQKPHSQPQPETQEEPSSSSSPPSSMVLIRNLQDSLTPDMLNLLLENVSGKNEDLDFSVERIPENQSVVVTFTCDFDVRNFIKNFQTNLRVSSLKLRAEALEEPTSVRIEGLPPNMPEDYIGLYFENPKHGGGAGSVKDIMVLPEMGAALVTFSDARAAKKALATKHMISKKDVSVYPYFPAQDIVLYGKQRPCIEKPEPVMSPISPYILEFILKDETLKDHMEKTMKTHHCDVKWPELLCPQPSITLSFPEDLSSHLRTMAKLVPTWKDEVKNKFSLLISKFKVIEYKMHQSAWGVIREKIKSPTYHDVLIKPDLPAEKVFLAGLTKDVTKIDPTFRTLVEATTTEAERKSQSITEDIPVSPALYQIMCNCGTLENILKQVPELNIDYNAPTKKARLSGLKEEVLTGKFEILSIAQQMKSKLVPLNPQLLEFLMTTDNEDLSGFLFLRHKINALMEIDDNSVKLTAYSKSDLMEAEEQMIKELICEELSVEDKNILRSPEWRKLHSDLLQRFNAEKSTVRIVECPSGVMIAGLCSNVQKCRHEVSDFLVKNTPMQRNIKVQSVAIMHFLKEEKKSMLDDLRKSMRLTTHYKIIRLKGAKLYVTEAESCIQKVLSSLCCDTLRIDKPGAKKFCLKNEDLYVTTARNKYRCVLHLEKDGEEDEIDEEETDEMDEHQCQVNHPSGTVISVRKEDLCRLNVDVVVNAANEDLKHIGGLALALLRAAGHKLQQESDEIIRKEGRLQAGESVVTDSGNLPCKQVIHTVGPRWNDRSPSQCEHRLRKAITSSLDLAEACCHKSIAIPAVSSGIFGCPVDECTRIIVESVKEYIDGKRGGSCLTDIRLVDTKEDTVRIFASNLRRVFGQQEPDLPPRYREKRTERPERFEKITPHNRVYPTNISKNQMTTREDIRIRVVEGLIQDAATDVVVNSVGRNLDLDNGGASRALLQKAGMRLQQCLSDARQGGHVGDGAMFITEGCNLSCKTVIHVVAPHWDRGQGQSEQIFRHIIRTCLSETEKRRMKSITFPAIGTGNLSFPSDAVAAFMFEEILKFSSESKARHLREVDIILHHNDQNTITEFYKELAKKMDRNATRSGQSYPVSTGSSHSYTGAAGSSQNAQETVTTGPVFFGTVTTPTQGVHEMKLGSVTYQVKSGDISKEDTDIIVNSTDQTFTMKSGVSKAILEAAGPSVENECLQLGAQSNGNHIVTKNGNLRCKNILHLVGRNRAEGIKDFISEALAVCAQLKASSVAFPAIGTGMGNIPSAMVADIILEAVAQFARSPKSIQMVKVVIFQKQMLNDFHSSMKKKEGTGLAKQESLLSKITQFTKSVFSIFRSDDTEEPKMVELRENIEPVVFHLCAESRDLVNKTSSWLRDLILKEQHENVITDDWIREFDERDQEALIQLQKDHTVSLIFDLPNFTVKVLGLSKDVLEVSNKIQDMIKNVRDKKTREREAQLCSNVVEWGYYQGTNFIPFDKMTNMELEKAKTEDRQSLSIDIAGAKYTVIVELNIARDSRGNQTKIERKPKHGQLELPQHWDPMPNENVKLVPLAAGSKEYTDVETEFRKTCAMRIVKIERVQNRHMWINYQIKKQSIDEKNGTTNNEMRLFHGLDGSTVKSVNHNGFNRSYAGKNAACYGNGTYFAVQASYSAHDTYSRPDANRIKHMYLARVATGMSCVGHSGLVAPPVKNSANPTDLYDSVTDSTPNPVMYIIFNDIQAYPEYLITFTH